MTHTLSKLPIERLFVRPPDNRKRLRELAAILSESHAHPAQPSPEVAEESREDTDRVLLEPRRQKVHLEAPTSELSTAETVAYQNREIAKNLVVLEKHYSQKLTIAGKRCDCGAGRHLLAIESLAEETIPMVDNPEVYYHIIEWCRAVSPKSTTEAAKSGRFDEEYSLFSRQARDFRKEVIVSLETAAMFPKDDGAPLESPPSESELSGARLA